MNRRKFLKNILSYHRYFFFVFAEYLDDEWHDDWWQYDEKEDVCVMVGGTNGWGNALKNTCKALNMESCYEYYNSLDWEESDELDIDIMCLLEALVFDENGRRVRGEI